MIGIDIAKAFPIVTLHLTCLMARKVNQMNIQLHRKQIVILSLALLLAVASYWIPAPEKPSSANSLLGTSTAVVPQVAPQPAPVITAPIAAEPLPTAQLVVEPLAQPQALKNSPPKTNAHLPKQAPPSKSSFLDARDLVNGNTFPVGTMLLVPIKNFDLPQKP